MFFRVSVLLLASVSLCAAFDRVPLAKYGCVSTGEQIHVPGENGVTPPIPDRANQLPKLRGSASFELVVNADGVVCEVVVKRVTAASSDAQLAAAKLKEWKFKPAQKAGRPVAVRFNVNLNQAR